MEDVVKISIKVYYKDKTEEVEFDDWSAAEAYIQVVNKSKDFKNVSLIKGGD